MHCASSSRGIVGLLLLSTVLLLGSERAAVADDVVEGDQALGDFSVLGATKTGKTLFVNLPAARTLDAAITQAADALGKVFDAAPTLTGGFADAKTKTTGGASLTGKLKGQAVGGVIFCGTSAGGGSATVVFAAADAPEEDVAALMAFMPAQLKVEAHKFPDGSGSVDLPEGWTTASPSATHGFVVVGPAGQSVMLSNITAVSDPDCRMVRLARQTYQMQVANYEAQVRMYQRAVAMHQRFPNTLAPREPVRPVAPDPDPNVAFPGVPFCRYCDGAEEVLKYWYPLREGIAKRGGGPYTMLEKVIAVVAAPANPLIPKSKAGVALLAVTDHAGDKVTPMRALNWIATAPIIPGEQWQLSISNVRAPAATFDRDLPVMMAIVNSVSLDMKVVTGQMNAEGAALRKMSDDMFQQILKNGRDFQDQQARDFARGHARIAAQTKARQDSASDFIEYIGGVRHVYDNQTGKTLNVNLSNANQVVSQLNQGVNDPKRFVEVPLRSER